MFALVAGLSAGQFLCYGFESTSHNHNHRPCRWYAQAPLRAFYQPSLYKALQHSLEDNGLGLLGGVGQLVEEEDVELAVLTQLLQLDEPHRLNVHDLAFRLVVDGAAVDGLRRLIALTCQRTLPRDTVGANGRGDSEPVSSRTRS